MANIGLIWKNHADGAAISGGGWQSDLPLANLKNSDQSLVARSTNAERANTKFIVDHAAGSDTAVVMPYASVILCNNNLSKDAEVRVRCHGTTNMPEVGAAYDSGWVKVYGSLYSSEYLEWESDNWWWGYLSEADMVGYRRNYVLDFGSTCGERYTQVEIKDVDNTADYVQIGRLLCGPIWRPAINMTYGKQVGYESRSVVDQALDGHQVFDQRQSVRSIRFSLDSMSKNEAMQQIFEIQRQLDIHGEVFVVPDADDPFNTFRESFLGRFRKLTPVEEYAYNLHRNSIEIEESL